MVRWLMIRYEWSWQRDVFRSHTSLSGYPAAPRKPSTSTTMPFAPPAADGLPLASTEGIGVTQAAPYAATTAAGRAILLR